MGHIREARLRAGMTQQQAADAIGVSVQGYQYYEYGSRDPKASTLRKLAEAFGCSVAYLIGTSDVPQPVQAVGLAPDEVALLADYRALDAAPKAFVRRTAASEAAEARAKMPAPRSASSEVA